MIRRISAEFVKVRKCLLQGFVLYYFTIKKKFETFIVHFCSNLKYLI